MFIFLIENIPMIDLCFNDSIMEKYSNEGKEIDFLLKIHNMNEKWFSLKYITSGNAIEALLEALEFLRV